MKIEETVIDSIRSRPRFKIYTDITAEEYAVYLKSFLDENAENYSGNINSETAIITVKTAHNDYWKPNLALRTEFDHDENKTAVRGIFGPTSAVWTFFMFLYFIFGILWMVFITIWFVERQINSNDFPWALTASFATIFLLLVVYFASLIGQRKAKWEMQKLREFAEESIRKYENHAAGS